MATATQADPVLSTTAALQILVVDDSDLTRRLVSFVLESLGHDVAATSSGIEALELFRSAKFDVLVVDFEMPGMDGLQVMEAIHAQSPITPVIILTAHEDVDLAMKMMRSGAIDFLTKSSAKHDLPHAVQRAAAFAHQQRELHKETCSRRDAELALKQLNENLARHVYRP